MRLYEWLGWIVCMAEAISLLIESVYVDAAYSSRDAC